MICPPCLSGDHCGDPGEITPKCPCQHFPPGTRQTASATARQRVRGATERGLSQPAPTAPVPAVDPAPAKPSQTVLELLARYGQAHAAGDFPAARKLRTMFAEVVGRTAGGTP